MELSETSHGPGRRTYVVYETRTGRIVHTVYVDFVKGAEVPSETEIEKQVMISASHVTRIAEETLSLLSVGPGRLKPGMIYEVDPKARDLSEKKISSPRTKDFQKKKARSPRTKPRRKT